MTMYLLIALASWYVRVCMHILVLPGDVIDTLTGNKMKTGSIQLKLEALPDTLFFFFFFFPHYVVKYNLICLPCS